MYVIEHLENARNPLFSYEIIPPARGKSVKDILDIVEQIYPYEPPFIDVTSHSAEAYYEELNDGMVRRRIRKKRPGTISICGIIQNRYNIDTVAHLLCRGFTKEETEDAMIELNYLGIHNVLAVRGDEINYKPPRDFNRSANVYAIDLVEQLNDLKNGKYIESISNAEPMPICIGVGGYPEKHYESPNYKTDLMHLKRKVEKGADYIVTQMLFDNSAYFDFVKKCQEVGITVPIIPGIKIINKVSQLTSIPKKFFVNLPEELVDEIMENRKHVREIGRNWAVKQCKELMEHGVKCLHFYIMTDATSVIKVIKNL
ncbi:MAG: methylenetetrahydrofolate reductase [NAD(P)H] [candidate division Zixibacteria bacterium]|nr:methylenetetrahydrofolate reductase [NAD(P)H] [candidate division Zixibacteria bacterium]